MSSVEVVTVEQVFAGNQINVGSGFFTVKTVRDGLRKGVGVRTTEGEYAVFPFGMKVERRVAR